MEILIYKKILMYHLCQKMNSVNQRLVEVSMYVQP
jgi:hypothetical protein